MNFEELNLNDSILKAIADMGFTEPTPIQGEVIPMLLESKDDVIALAQTGTGKTAAFGLPLIHNIDSTERITKGVVLCPTRELCLQIHTEMAQFAKYTRGLRMTAVYGGIGYRIPDTFPETGLPDHYCHPRSSCRSHQKRRGGSKLSQLSCNG